jgi:hypothetical protein
LAICKAVKLDLALLAVAGIAIFIQIATDYSGGCPSTMDGGGRGGCSVIFGFLFEFIFGFLFYLLYYWWMTLPALALPILIGLLIDLLGEAKND